jgi:hypothetical protein
MKFTRLLAGFLFLFLGLAAPVSAFAATLSLSPTTGTFNRGCSFSLAVNVDTTGTQTDGTDAIIIYDPTRFTVTSITNGSIYSDYPGNNDDPAAGKITISGLASVSTPFTGAGALATVNFTVKANAPAGASVMKFDFDPNDKAKTTDSNVVERGTVVDVLNSVTNGNYTVGTGACGAAGDGTDNGGGLIPGKGGLIGTPSAQPPLKQLPSGGTEQFTYTIVIVGSILTVLGILGLALL